MTPENPLPSIFTRPEMGFAPRPRTTSELIQDPNSPLYISEDAHVLLVGPGIYRDLPMDLHGLILPAYLGKGGGSLTFVDLPPSSIKGGYHDLPQVKKTLDNLQEQSGLPFCPIDYVQKDVLSPEAADVIRNQAERESFDVIIDHLTLQYWLIAESLSNAFIATHFYARLLQEENGKAHVFYKQRSNDTFTMHRLETVSRALMLAFSVENVPVTDLYRIKPELRESLNLYAHATKPATFRPCYNADGVFVCTNSTEGTRLG